MPKGIYKHKPMSEEAKRKIVNFRLGKPSGMLGKHHTEESKRKISVAGKGKILSAETRTKMSKAKKGIKGSYGNLGNKYSIEVRKKLSKSHTGVKLSEDHRRKIAEGQMREKHWHWVKDRNSLEELKKGRRSAGYQDWRRTVYNRDKFRCKLQNNHCYGRIEAHHIYNWIDYPDLRYQINNGITLCHFHHPRGRKNEKLLASFFSELVGVSEEKQNE